MTFIAGESSALSKSLADSVKELSRRSGSREDQLRREIIISKFIANCDDKKHRVLCRGNHCTSEVIRPAVLIYHPDLNVINSWTVDEHDAVIVVDVKYFHSNIPHIGIAREVFSTESSTI